MDLKTKDASLLTVAVADQISAMIAYWDKDLVCRFANSAYVDWFGKTKEQMINKLTISELLGPLYEKNYPFIAAALNGETQTFEREIPLPNGTIRHALANYYPDYVNGEVVGFFVHVADVSTLKLREKELRTYNEKISEQNKRLLNFSNIVSHNLKSYSNNLTSILYLLAAAKSEDEKNKLLSFINRISARLASTVNHLNEITKLQNLNKLSPERINLNEYIEKTKESLLIEIEQTGAEITNKVDKNSEILANPAYTESILLNLLSNAIKYRQKDKAPVIELSAFEEQDKIILTIKDNGQGINLEKHGEDLFGMYKTFHGNPDAEGIGLFITKYQVETMGGTKEVESEENSGTTFTISFLLP